MNKKQFLEKQSEVLKLLKTASIEELKRKGVINEYYKRGYYKKNLHHIGSDNKFIEQFN